MEPVSRRSGFAPPPTPLTRRLLVYFPSGAYILAVGHGRRLENGELIALDVKVGDRILFGKYSGSETNRNGDEYLILREDEVLGILDNGAPPEKKTK